MYLLLWFHEKKDFFVKIDNNIIDDDNNFSLKKIYLLIINYNTCNLNNYCIVSLVMMICMYQKWHLQMGHPVLVIKQGCFHPIIITIQKILLLLKILPIIVLWCRIARNLILRLWNMPFKKFEENTCYYYYYYLTITLMLSLYERFSCQFSEIKKWYT